MYIGNKKDFQKLISKINSVDEEIFNQSNEILDSKTKAIGIYQLFIKLYNTGNPIGSNVFFTRYHIKFKVYLFSIKHCN